MIKPSEYRVTELRVDVLHKGEKIGDICYNPLYPKIMDMGIEEKHQRKGWGKKVTKLLVDYVAAHQKHKTVILENVSNPEMALTAHSLGAVPRCMQPHTWEKAKTVLSRIKEEDPKFRKEFLESIFLYSDFGRTRGLERERKILERAKPVIERMPHLEEDIKTIAKEMGKHDYPSNDFDLEMDHEKSLKRFMDEVGRLPGIKEEWEIEL